MYSSATAPSRHFATVTIRPPPSNSPTTQVHSPEPNLIGWEVTWIGVPPVELGPSLRWATATTTRTTKRQGQ
jgi:hypothetical protein